MRVLVVDDYPGAAEISCVLLELMGHHARHALDGHGALAQAAAFAPELILLDIGLPDLSGYDVARALRARPATRRVHIAAVTGWCQPEDRIKSIAAGIDEYVLKPASEAKLREIIEVADLRARGSLS